MTLEEAKQFYYQYRGSSFHMGREEPARYNMFRMLHIGEETLKEWDEELLDALFATLWTVPNRIWVPHENILKIIQLNHCDTPVYLSRLLDEMKKMEHLDHHNLTLILENMAGRTEPMKDGGVYTICKYSGLAERMNTITERLIATCTARCDVDERFETAVRSYRKAYEKWGGSGR